MARPPEHMPTPAAVIAQWARLGVSEAVLAEGLGVWTTDLAAWASGRATPSARILSQLSAWDTLAQLLPQVFAGPDLARQWLHTAHPESLSGRTPVDLLRWGQVDCVHRLLEHLARDA